VRGMLVAITRPVSAVPGVLTSREDSIMLWTIAVILLILWVLGFFVVHVGGGLIHLLLVIAVIVIIYRLITGRPVV
jgi:hypothetical protein